MSARIAGADRLLLILMLASMLASVAVVWRALTPPDRCAVEAVR